MLLLYYSTKVIPATSTEVHRQYLNAKIVIILHTTKKKDEKVWIYLGYRYDIARI
jgi:hypothetical protein